LAPLHWLLEATLARRRKRQSPHRESRGRAGGDSATKPDHRKIGRLGPKLLLSSGRGERRSRNWRGNGSGRKMKQRTFFLFMIKIAPSRFSYLLKVFT